MFSFLVFNGLPFTAVTLVDVGPLNLFVFLFSFPRRHRRAHNNLTFVDAPFCSLQGVSFDALELPKWSWWHIFKRFFSSLTSIRWYRKNKFKSDSDEQNAGPQRSGAVVAFAGGTIDPYRALYVFREAQVSKSN
jgi:hypothetical protein